MKIEGSEDRRVASLKSYDILDTAPEEEFDALTRLVASACDVPIALLSFVDSERQWFKSRVGVSVCETSRDSSFCSLAIAQPESVFTVADTLLDARFADNPLVTGDPFLRFYTGVPIVSDDGFALGTLCVIDTRPRALTPKQTSILLEAAACVRTLLTYRRLRTSLLAGAGAGPSTFAAESFRPDHAAATAPFAPGFVALGNGTDIPSGVIDALPGAFFILDSAGRFLLWNRRLQEVSGYSDDELAAPDRVEALR